MKLSSLACKVFSPNPQVQAQINWLLSLGLPPIPIQPAPHHKKPPSYLDEDGRVCYFSAKYGEPNFNELIERDPTEEELTRWFQHPKTGIGTISGRNQIYWIDVDSKHFPTRRDCAIATSQWWNQQTGYMERTGSMGYHVPVRCNTEPKLYAVSFSEDGDRVGEILSHGTFVVLAPSLHKSGKHYEILKHGDPIEIKDWGEIGLYPAKPKPLPQGFTRPVFNAPKTDFKPIERISDFDLASDILGGLPPELADDTPTWLKVGGALWSLEDPRCLKLWEDWSRQSPKFREGECRRRWGRFKFGHIGTLINLGKQHGWEHPQKKFTPEERKEYRDLLDFENWQKLRRYTPDVDVTRKDGKPWATVPDEMLASDISFALKSGLSTGKTELQGHIRDISDRGSRSIGSRNTLEIQTAERLSRNGRNHYHVRRDIAHHLLRDRHAHLHGAIDTMAICGTPEDTEEVDIYLDEFCQLLEHTTGGETLGYKQVYAMKNFEAISQISPRIMAFDGNLKDYEVDFLRRISDKKIVKLINRAKPASKNFFFVDGIDTDHLEDESFSETTGLSEEEIKKNTEELKSKAEKSAILSLLLDPKSIPFVVSDSLKQVHVLKKMLKASGREGVYALTAETENEPWAKEFLKNPTQWIKENKPSAFLGSPVIQSGLDIHAIVNEDWVDAFNAIAGQSWFTAGFGIFCGVLLTDGQTQILNRLRDPDVSWYISCPDRGLPVPRYFPKSYDPEEVKKQAEAYIKLNASLVARSEKDKDQRKYETIQRLIDDFLERSNDAWWDLYCTIVAQNNYERNNLRKCLEWKLQQDGHRVDNILQLKADQLKEGYKQASDEWVKGVAYEITERPVRTEDEIERIRRKSDKTKADIRDEQRYSLESKLPNIGQSEIWGRKVVIGIDREGNEIIKQLSFQDFIAEVYVKRSDKLSCLERFWLLLNIDIAQKQSDKRWLNFVNNNLGKEYRGRLLGNPFLTLWALNELRVTRLLEGEHHANSEVFQDIYERGKTDSHIKIALGFTPGKPGKTKKNGESKVVTEYVKRIADLAGIPLKSHRKRIEGGVIQVYRLDEQKINDPYRVEALKRIEERWRNWDDENKVIDWDRVLEEQIGFAPDENIELPPEEVELLQEEQISREMLDRVVLGREETVEAAIAQAIQEEIGREVYRIVNSDGTFTPVFADEFEEVVEFSATTAVTPNRHPELKTYQAGDAVWYWHPFSEKKWLEGTVEAVEIVSKNYTIVKVNGPMNKFIDEPGEICLV